MPKTWANEDACDATCSHCGAVYLVVVTRFPARDKDFFACVVCGEKMAEWNGTHCPSFTLKDSDSIK